MKHLPCPLDLFPHLIGHSCRIDSKIAQKTARIIAIRNRTHAHRNENKAESRRTSPWKARKRGGSQFDRRLFLRSPKFFDAPKYRNGSGKYWKSGSRLGHKLIRSITIAATATCSYMASTG